MLFKKTKPKPNPALKSCIVAHLHTDEAQEWNGGGVGNP